MYYLRTCFASANFHACAPRNYLFACTSRFRDALCKFSLFLVIIALITFVTNFWSVTYYSLKNFTVITMS